MTITYLDSYYHRYEIMDQDQNKAINLAAFYVMH